MDWEERSVLTLREVLDRIQRENRVAKRTKRELSHALANGFIHTLKPWVHIADEPLGNANYFCIEIGPITLSVTPFCSHEEWWEKPSKGFREMVARKRCRWGVVLFNLPKSEGLWIEGPAFDEKVLRDREKVNSSVVREARRNRVGQAFSESNEFIEIIQHPPKTPGKPYLVPRRA